MSTTKLITMYGSPWSERVRWALKFKGLAYEKENYEPGVDEEKIKKLTGQAMVPVLIADGKMIPDSTAILEWLEHAKPEPALLPRSEKDRAQVSLWEELAIGVLGPHGRTLIIGRQLRINHPEMKQTRKVLWGEVRAFGVHGGAGQAYGEAAVGEPQGYLSGRQYLVGDAFTRADLTTAAMLMLLKPPPEEFFAFSRIHAASLYGPAGDDPAFAAIFAWRDQMYKKHRGEAVKP